MINKDDLLELGWGLICNASNRTIEEGPVDASPGWPEAALKFREQYFSLLKEQYGERE